MKKFKKGTQIKTLNTLLKEIDKGNYVFLRHKPQHPGWVKSMQFKNVADFVKNKYVWKAEITKEWIEKNTIPF